MKTVDITAVGEVLVEFCEIERQHYQQSFSGDVLNTLWMASTVFNKSTALVSAVGDDCFTDALLSECEKANIDVGCIRRQPSRPNGLYFIHQAQAGEPEFHFLRTNSAATTTFDSAALPQIRQRLKASRFVLCSSILMATVEDREVMLECLKQSANDARLMFDLNVRVALWQDMNVLREIVSQLAPYADTLFVSHADDSALFGNRSPERAIEEFKALGYRRIVYRQSALPTLASLDGEDFVVPTYPTKTVVDSTGAGDAFNAGYLVGQLDGLGELSSLQLANAAAASVLSVRGGRATGVTKQAILQHIAGLQS